MVKHDIDGILVSVSHMFYLSKENKMFLLRIATDEKNSDKFIICSLSSTLLPATKETCKSILLDPPLGRRMKIGNLKHVILHKNSEEAMEVSQLTKAS